MTLPRFQTLVLAGGLLATAHAFAQDQARALDLTVPQAPLRFETLGAAEPYRNDPPGTWYGDHGSRPAWTGEPASAGNNDWRVHGSVEAGIGWSSRGGNSNWQGANVNLDKTYVDDQGDTGHVNIDISVGRGEGPVYGPGYFAPDYLDAPPMRGRPPFRR